MAIDLDSLTRAQRQHRMNVRNYLLVATISEIEKELTIGNCPDRKRFVQEILDERLAEEAHDSLECHDV